MKYLPSVDIEELPDRLIFMHTFTTSSSLLIRKYYIHVSRHIFRAVCATSCSPVPYLIFVSYDWGDSEVGFFQSLQFVFFNAAWIACLKALNSRRIWILLSSCSLKEYLISPFRVRKEKTARHWVDSCCGICQNQNGWNDMIYLRWDIMGNHDDLLMNLLWRVIISSD